MLLLLLFSLLYAEIVAEVVIVSSAVLYSVWQSIKVYF